MKNYCKLFLFISFFLSNVFVFGHHGGHGEVDATELRPWHDTESKLVAQGSFLFTHDGVVVVEDAHGKKIELKLESLSWNDVYYVVTYTKAVEKINTTTYSAPVIVDNGYRIDLQTVLIILATFILALAIAYYLIYRQGYSWTYPGTFMAAFFCASMVYLISCSGEEAPDKEPDGIATSDPNIINQAFDPYQHLVDTRFDNKYFYVESQGIPDHQMDRASTDPAALQRK